jgi:heme/copper-type cytochrome/quinol oxidase subunit 2
MFSNIDLLYIFGPALLIAIIFLVTIKNRSNKQNASELSKAIDHFKITSIVFGALLVVLWLSLPSTPSLKSFGYPDDISAIKGDAKVLNLFQEYNKAIVRTTEVLQWFMFLFIWWFLTILFGVAKAYKNSEEKAFAQHQ